MFSNVSVLMYAVLHVGMGWVIFSNVSVVWYAVLPCTASFYVSLRSLDVADALIESGVQIYNTDIHLMHFHHCSYSLGTEAMTSAIGTCYNFRFIVMPSIAVL